MSVVWLQPLAAPTIIVACGPRRISDAISTTYETDMFEPLAIGNWTLKADVSEERHVRALRALEWAFCTVVSTQQVLSAWGAE